MMQLMFRIGTLEDRNTFMAILRRNGYDIKSEHRVLVDVPTPKEPEEKSEFRPMSCPACLGKGNFPNFSTDRLSPYEVECSTCKGKGILWRKEDKK